MAFTIDGNTFNMPCGISRQAQVKSSSVSGDMLDGTYYNDVIGTYLQYDITIAVPSGMESRYSALFEILSDPVGTHMVTVPYNQGTKTFECKIETVSDKLYRQEGSATIWRGISFTCTGTEPVKKPSGDGSGISIARDTLGSFTATANGTYSASNNGVDGFSDVTVNVPQVAGNFGTKEITANGTYDASDEVIDADEGTTLDGFSSVTVNVPVNVAEKSITGLGTYNATDDSVEGYSTVKVIADEGTLISPTTQYIATGNYISKADGETYDENGTRTLVTFNVVSGHTYIYFLGAVAGDRFRMAYFATNPVGTGSDTTGTQSGDDIENPGAYYGRIYQATADGFVVIQTDNSSNAIKAYCLDITNPEGTS